MSHNTTITVELPKATHEQLELLAVKFGRDKQALALEALLTYLDYETWKIEEIRKGIHEADAGQFASDSEVDAVFSKWA